VAVNVEGLVVEIQKASGASPGIHGRAVARENIRVELQVEGQVPQLAQSGRRHFLIVLHVASIPRSHAQAPKQERG